MHSDDSMRYLKHRSCTHTVNLRMSSVRRVLRYISWMLWVQSREIEYNKRLRSQHPLLLESISLESSPRQVFRSACWFQFSRRQMLSPIQSRLNRRSMRDASILSFRLSINSGEQYIKNDHSTTRVRSTIHHYFIFPVSIS